MWRSEKILFVGCLRLMRLVGIIFLVSVVVAAVPVFVAIRAGGIELVHDDA